MQLYFKLLFYAHMDTQVSQKWYACDMTLRREGL